MREVIYGKRHRKQYWLLTRLIHGLGQTLDKTMGDLRHASRVRKNLTGHELEQPIAAVKGDQKETRGRFRRKIL